MLDIDFEYLPLFAELESEVEKFKENDNQEKKQSLKNATEGLAKQTKNNFIREGSNIANIQPKKPASGNILEILYTSFSLNLSLYTRHYRKFSLLLDCMNCKRLREEKNELQSKLKEKEENLRKALARISENVSKSRKDKLALENENHRMRIKYAESRVGQMLRSNCSKSTPNLDKILPDR